MRGLARAHVTSSGGDMSGWQDTAASTMRSSRCLAWNAMQ